jgi:hypothetical protein
VPFGPGSWGCVGWSVPPARLTGAVNLRAARVPCWLVTDEAFLGMLSCCSASSRHARESQLWRPMRHLPPRHLLVAAVPTRVASARVRSSYRQACTVRGRWDSRASCIAPLPLPILPRSHQHSADIASTSHTAAVPTPWHSQSTHTHMY